MSRPQRGDIVVDDPFAEEFEKPSISSTLRRDAAITSRARNSHTRGTIIVEDQYVAEFAAVTSPANHSHGRCEQRNVVDGVESIVVQPDFEQLFCSSQYSTVAQSDELCVVLDGANIGKYRYSTADSFEAALLKQAIDFFQSRGVRVIAFIPQSYHTKRPAQGESGNARMQTDDWDILDALVAQEVVIRVPPGVHDDECILQYAREHSAIIVSNDFFTDHWNKLEELSVEERKGRLAQETSSERQYH